jgi:hypothetical protein
MYQRNDDEDHDDHRAAAEPFFCRPSTAPDRSQADVYVDTNRTKHSLFVSINILRIITTMCFVRAKSLHDRIDVGLVEEKEANDAQRLNSIQGSELFYHGQ